MKDILLLELVLHEQTFNDMVFYLFLFILSHT